MLNRKPSAVASGKGGVPLPGWYATSCDEPKSDIAGALRSLSAEHRLPGAPVVPFSALGRYLGVDRRALYKVMAGEPCSNALRARLSAVLARIFDGRLIFEQRERNGPYLPRSVKPCEVPPEERKRVHAFKVSLSSSGPRLQLQKFGATR